MALAPALGLSMLLDLGPGELFTFSAAMSLFAIGTARVCSEKENAPALPVPTVHSSVHHRLFEAGTGVPAVLTILFGAAYGSVNTFIAMLANETGIGHVNKKCKERLNFVPKELSRQFQRSLWQHGAADAGWMLILLEAGTDGGSRLYH